jgi:glutathione synthase/RimK-type ligase-like ATP-grasp enzyme
MRAVILPYKKGSQSAKALAVRLGELLGQKVYRVETGWKQKRPTTVINWGHSLSNAICSNMWNKYAMLAGNKLDAFKFMQEKCNVPDWTEDKEIARGWSRDGARVVARTVLNGHSGNGIIMFKGDEPVPNAPLYVKYIPKKREYRVHVVFGQVIDIQQKRKHEGFPKEDTNFQVRNHHTGWVYCRENLEYSDEIKVQAIKACEALQLEFGAVDIIWNEKQDKYYVLEVNTAPGLEGLTVESYAQAFYKELTK